MREEPWLCADCGVDTSVLGEEYMVTPDLWNSSGMTRGYLCVGCLENRIGRPITPNDFTLWHINCSGRKSHRLANRLGAKVDKLGRHRPFGEQSQTYMARILATDCLRFHSHK